MAEFLTTISKIVIFEYAHFSSFFLKYNYLSAIFSLEFPQLQTERKHKGSLQAYVI